MHHYCDDDDEARVRVRVNRRLEVVISNRVSIEQGGID